MITSPFHPRWLGLGALAAALLLSGCGGSDGPVNNAPGPAVYSAFSGVTIDINPTISFLPNGQATYVNTASGSAFPGAATTISGTYTYTPASDYLSGALALTLPSLGQKLQLTFQSFTTQDGKVTSFTTVYNGQSYSTTVTSGTLTPAAVQGGTTSTGGSSGSGSSGSGSGGSGSSGSGSSGSGTTPTTIPTVVGANEAAADDIPAAMQGTYELTYVVPQTGSPFTEGTKKTFIIAAKSLSFDSKVLTNPVWRLGNRLEWIFKDGEIEYEVSQAVNGGLNEINVGKTGGTPWYGQFRVASGTAGSAGSGGTSGGSGSSGSGSSGGTNVTSGPLAAGTTFTRTVKSAIVAPNGAVTGGAPAYTVGQSVTFTVASDGALTFSGLTVPYSADGGSSLVYVRVISAGNSDTVTVYKNLTTGAPTSIGMQFVRTSTALPPSVQMITYTLE